MPPEYFSVFLEGRDLPEPDAYLGEQQTARETATAAIPSIDQLQADPDVAAVLEAAADLTPASSNAH
jgi:hypothetical protein